MNRVFAEYRDRLVNALPMDDHAFTTKLYNNKMFPGNLLSRIKSLPTESDKAYHFLENFIKPSINIDGTAEFEKLISVMKTSGYSHMKWLANEMESASERNSKGSYVCHNFIYVAIPVFEISQQKIER